MPDPTTVTTVAGVGAVLYDLVKPELRRLLPLEGLASVVASWVICLLLAGGAGLLGLLDFESWRQVVNTGLFAGWVANLGYMATRLPRPKAKEEPRVKV